METKATHILRKIDDLRARSEQRRSSNKKDVLTGKRSRFKENLDMPTFTAEQVEKHRLKYQKVVASRRQRNIWPIVIAIILLPIVLWFISQVFFHDLLF